MNKLLLVFFAVCFSVLSFGATITVTNTNDAGVGSLRQAILDANGSVGRDSIVFNIAVAGIHTITVSTGLPIIADEVYINGFSQSGINIHSIVIDGGGAIAFGLQIYDPSTSTKPDHSIIEGLTFKNFSTGIFFSYGLSTINDVTIKNCKINSCSSNGMNIQNTNRSKFINNEINNNGANGIYLYACNDNVIKANKIYSSGSNGIECTSSSKRNRIESNVIYSNNNNGIRLATSVNTTVISNNIHSNILSGILLISSADTCTITNNLIGTDSLYADKGNLKYGIRIDHPGHKKITINNNTIGYNTTAGISIYNGDTVTILGNNIGINDASLNIGNKGYGIELTNNTTNVKVGNGTLVGMNKIAYNLQDGIWNFYGVNEFNRNLIFNNIGKSINLGIQYSSWGNNTKQTPSITKAQLNGSNVTVTIQSESTDIRLEIYKGNNTNQDLLQFLTDATTAVSPGVWTATFPYATIDDYFMVVATGNTQNTSEAGYYIPKSLIVTNTNDSGSGSLRAAITAANVLNDTSRITFNIAGGPIPHVIKPLTELPIIKYSTIVDGRTDEDSIVLDGSLTNSSTNAGLMIGDATFPQPTGRSSKVIAIQFQNYKRGIYINGHESVQVIDSKFYGSTSTTGAISINQMFDSLLVENCLIKKCSTSVEQVQSSVGIKKYNINNTIIDSCNVGVSTYQSSADILITNSTITNSTTKGIFISFGSTSLKILNNVISGNKQEGINLYRAPTATIKGNIIGLNKSMTVAMPNKIGINADFTSPVTIDSNIISGNTEEGVYLSRTTGYAYRNYIGTTINNSNFGNGKSGLNARSPNTTLYAGGNQLDSANVIGFNKLNGVELSYGNVFSNYIGVSKTFSNIGNEANGVVCSSPSNAIVKNNTIGYNKLDGINTTTNIVIQNNNIGGNGIHNFKNNKYGIRTDYGSSIYNNIIFNNDSGAVFVKGFGNKISKNTFNNSPVAIYFATAVANNNNKAAPTNLAVTGYRLNGKSLANDSIEIFVATPGSLQTATKYLGHTKADINGDWSYNITGINTSISNAIVATATDAIGNGNTSRLSAQVLIAPCSMLVTNINDAGTGSLRVCIECANVNAGTDTIKFAIPGASSINLTNGPINIYDDIVIAGQTQLLQGIDSVSVKAPFPIFINNSSSGKLALNTLIIESTGGLAILNSSMDAMIDIKNSRITSIDIGLLSTTPRSFIFISNNKFYCKQPLKLEWVKSSLIEKNEFVNADQGISINNLNAHLANDVYSKQFILNNTFLNATTGGIYIETCSEITISNNNFQGCVNPFYAYDLNRNYSANSFSKINKNVFNNSKYKTSPTITINETGAIWIISQNNKIEIDSNNITNSEGGGIYTGQNGSFEITNNYIANNKGNGHSIYSLQNSLIENNTYENNSLNGFFASYPAVYKNNTFKNNKFIKNGLSGYNQPFGNSNNIFENNEFANNGLNGIQIRSSEGIFKFNIIKNNPVGLSMTNSGGNVKPVFESNTFDNPKNIEIYNNLTSRCKLSKNLFIGGDIAIDLARSTATPGNNNKDTATISSFVQTASYIDLFGKGLNADTIEVFNGNGNKEQTTAYVNHSKVTGTDWTLRIPVNAGYNPVANNYYLVTATDPSGNTSQLSNFIKIPLRLYSNTLNVLPKQAGICLGDSTQLDAVAEGVTYYKWYNKTTGAVVSSVKMPYFKKGGDYILEVGDSFGNTASDTIQIIENALPLASDFLMASEAGILDNIVAIDISYTKPDSLVWNWGAATAVFDTDKYLLKFPDVGTYTIQLTSYLGLCAKKTSHDITIVPGKLAPDIDTIYSSTIVHLSAGPNPVTTDITFNAELAYDEIVTTYIYTLLGTEVYTYKTPMPARSHTYQIDMSAVSRGAYIVKVISGVDQRVIKVIKQ